MTPCPKCGREPFGIMLGPPVDINGEYFEEVKCGSCGVRVGVSVAPAGVSGYSRIERAWEDAVRTP